MTRVSTGNKPPRQQEEVILKAVVSVSYRWGSKECRCVHCRHHRRFWSSLWKNRTVAGNLKAKRMH